MKTFAVLIIFFGSGKTAQFDVERFPDLLECEAAMSAIVADVNKDSWLSGPIYDGAARCVEVTQ